MTYNAPGESKPHENYFRTGTNRPRRPFSNNASFVLTLPSDNIPVTTPAPRWRQIQHHASLLDAFYRGGTNGFSANTRPSSSLGAPDELHGRQDHEEEEEALTRRLWVDSFGGGSPFFLDPSSSNHHHHALNTDGEEFSSDHVIAVIDSVLEIVEQGMECFDDDEDHSAAAAPLGKEPAQ